MERQTTTDPWTYRDAGTLGADPSRGLDLAGFSVEALDGGIGKVDEAPYETARSYVVVDTGPWIFGKKVMLPADVIERVDLDSETVFVGRREGEIGKLIVQQEAAHHAPRAERILDAGRHGEGVAVVVDDGDVTGAAVGARSVGAERALPRIGR